MPRISLRQLFFLVAFVALAITSLKYATPTWLAIVAAVTMVVFFAAAIVTAVDRGPRQAFAIGVTILMLGYGLIVVSGTKANGGNFAGAQVKNIEFDFEQGRLPTTRLLGRLFQSVVKRQYLDNTTGEVGFNIDPATRSTLTVLNELPFKGTFMRVGHCWWALLLGCIGGLFARFVYLRRATESNSLPKKE